MTRSEFVEKFGGMYEHSAWAAERAWHSRLAQPCSIIAAMRRAVDTASEQKIDSLIKAHPDLAGKLAISGKLTQSSKNEQTGAGLDQCSTSELEKFKTYNAAYKAKFRFPFIIAVKGLGRQEILESFENRLKNDMFSERQTALEQIHKIARLRIESLFDEQT